MSTNGPPWTGDPMDRLIARYACRHADTQLLHQEASGMLAEARTKIRGRGSSTHEDLRPTSGRKEHQVPNLRLLMNPSQWPLPLGFLSTFGHFRLTLRHTSLDVVEDDSDSSLNESELTRSTTAAEVSAASSLMREVLQPRSIRTKCASCHLRQHVQKLDSRWHNQVLAV